MIRSLLTFILALVVPLEAFACSPIVGYRVPTNIELLESADLVVLARVREGPVVCHRPGDERFCFSSVVLTPVVALKGEAPAELSVDGTLGGRRGESYSPVYTSLTEPHPSALWGACIRQAYSEGALVLAMFRERDGEWRQLGEAFARSIEDVQSIDALWVRAAVLYLDVIERSPSERRVQAFAAERDRYRAMTGDDDAQQIADDIDHYLHYAEDNAH